MTTSRDDAQAGNIRIESCLESKLLDLNTDKTVYIVIGNKKVSEKLRDDIKKEPLTINNTEIKEKEKYKYLGDIIHKDGLSASADATVKAREGRTTSVIIEIKSILDDCRLQIIGGALAGVDIWELAVIPSILTNAETWVHISDKTVTILEDIQIFMFRCLLGIPKTTPPSIILWDLGSSKMKFRIIEKKLNLFYDLVNLPDTALAKIMVNTQMKNGFPGLAQECLMFIKELNLPDITEIKITKESWKGQVKNAIRKENEKELRVDLAKSKKAKEFEDEIFETKSYFKELNLIQARLIFKQRSKMMQHIKMNYSSDPQYIKEMWKCDWCSCISTQSHILWCTEFSDLRENLDLNVNKDLAKYFQEVLRVRAEKEH